jgi:hypothetical protein
VAELAEMFPAIRPPARPGYTITNNSLLLFWTSLGVAGAKAEAKVEAGWRGELRPRLSAVSQLLHEGYCFPVPVCLAALESITQPRLSLRQSCDVASLVAGAHASGLWLSFDPQFWTRLGTETIKVLNKLLAMLSRYPDEGRAGALGLEMRKQRLLLDLVSASLRYAARARLRYPPQQNAGLFHEGRVDVHTNFPPSSPNDIFRPRSPDPFHKPKVVVVISSSSSSESSPAVPACVRKRSRAVVNDDEELLRPATNVRKRSVMGSSSASSAGDGNAGELGEASRRRPHKQLCRVGRGVAPAAQPGGSEIHEAFTRCPTNIKTETDSLATSLSASTSIDSLTLITEGSVTMAGPCSRSSSRFRSRSSSSSSSSSGEDVNSPESNQTEEQPSKVSSLDIITPQVRADKAEGGRAAGWPKSGAFVAAADKSHSADPAPTSACQHEVSPAGMAGNSEMAAVIDALNSSERVTGALPAARPASNSGVETQASICEPNALPGLAELSHAWAEPVFVDSPQTPAATGPDRLTADAMEMASGTGRDQEGDEGAAAALASVLRVAASLPQPRGQDRGDARVCEFVLFLCVLIMFCISEGLSV